MHAPARCRRWLGRTVHTGRADDFVHDGHRVAPVGRPFENPPAATRIKRFLVEREQVEHPESQVRGLCFRQAHEFAAHSALAKWRRDVHRAKPRAQIPARVHVVLAQARRPQRSASLKGDERDWQLLTIEMLPKAIYEGPERGVRHEETPLVEEPGGESVQVLQVVGQVRCFHTDA